MAGQDRYEGMMTRETNCAPLPQAVRWPGNTAGQTDSTPLGSTGGDNCVTTGNTNTHTLILGIHILLQYTERIYYCEDYFLLFTILSILSTNGLNEQIERQYAFLL